MCGEADTVEHRIHSCFCSAIEDNLAYPTSISRQRAIFMLPSVLKASEGYILAFHHDGLLVEPFTFDPSDGPIYTDGSVYEGNHVALARGGCAVAQPGARKVLQYTIEADLPATAAVTEHVGLLMAATYTTATALNIGHIHADCAGLVSFIDRQHQALAYSCPMAGIWRQIIEKPAWPHVRIHKTKAHRSLAQATKADDQQHFVGNDVADSSAKEAAAKHGVQDPELSEFLQTAKNTQVSLTQAVAALIKYNTYVVLLELQPLPPTIKRKDQTERHAYQRFGLSLWICRGCGHHAKTSHFVKAIRKCNPFSPIITNLFAEHVDANSTKGHSLRLASFGLLTKIVYCMRCGSYGTHRFSNLHRQCKRSASGQSARLSFFENNQHPKGGTLHNIIHVTFGVIQSLLSQPTYDGPTEAQSAVAEPPLRTAKHWHSTKYTAETFKVNIKETPTLILTKTISSGEIFDKHTRGEGGIHTTHLLPFPPPYTLHVVIFFTMHCLNSLAGSGGTPLLLPARTSFSMGPCIPAPPPPPKHKPHLVLPPVHSQELRTTTAPADSIPHAFGPNDPVRLPDEPYCWASHDAIDHFTGPWSLIGVGLDGDGGWASMQAYMDVGLDGVGEPVDGWNNVEDIRARTWDWASLHDTEVRAFLGDKFTWTACATATDEFGNDVSGIYFHSGNWAEWLNSLTTSGRWLDLPALLCALGAFDCAAFIVEARDGDILCYHFGDIKRQDGAVLHLGLHNRQWYFVRPRSTARYPDWWYEIPPTWPDMDSINGR
jgi:hypothetical protein